MKIPLGKRRAGPQPPLQVGHHQGTQRQCHDDSDPVKGKETNQHLRSVLKGTADCQAEKKPKIK